MLYGTFAFGMFAHSENLIWMDLDPKAVQELQLGFPILFCNLLSQVKS